MHKKLFLLLALISSSFALLAQEGTWIINEVAFDPHPLASESKKTRKEYDIKIVEERRAYYYMTFKEDGTFEHLDDYKEKEISKWSISTDKEYLFIYEIDSEDEVDVEIEAAQILELTTSSFVFRRYENGTLVTVHLIPKP
jgi:hypothetical protein